MKVFDSPDTWGSKVNFVDENNVMLGYDMAQDCCEHFGWFVSDKLYGEYPDYEKPGYAEIIGNHGEGLKWSAYRFDPSFHIQIGAGEAGGMATFKIVSKFKKYKPMFLYLFNLHNGYYAHGFEFCNGETVIVESSI
jgi:hypothetical protein